MILMVGIYSTAGQKLKDTKLPAVFSEPIRQDLINRASLSIRSEKFQPKGVYFRAGLETSADYVGRRRAFRTMMNIGRARLPKVKLPKGRMGEVRIVPQARKGRAPHPPKPEHILIEKMNRKEMRKALRSAIAATAVKTLAEKRSHVLNGIKELPIIVDDSFEALKKTKEVRDALNKLGLEAELERASEIKIRAGRGKSRGRRYKRKRSVLLVTGKEGALKAAENITGVDVRAWNTLDADVLAPGGVPGRLTIYTESALKAMEKM